MGMHAPLFSAGFRVLFCVGILSGALLLRLLTPDSFCDSEPTLPSGTEELANAPSAQTGEAAQPPETEVCCPLPSVTLPTFTAEEADAIEIRGNCDYAVDKTALLLSPLHFAADDRKQVLIVHTHTTEAYSPQDYPATGAFHTLDETQNILAVGDALTEALEALGVGVIHDRSCHDYPDYNSSYANAKQTIEAQLAENPSIVLVIDLHRDALDKPVREATELGGEACARLMLVVGTDEGGLYHPFWQENLACALKLQALLNRHAPTLCRPLNLRRERFNGQSSPGAILVEVGSTGNTLEEALRSMPYLAEAIAELLGAGGQ